MTDKEQKLIELGYHETIITGRYIKKVEYNNRPYWTIVLAKGNYFELSYSNVRTQQDIDDLQIVYNRTQDELRKAGILE